MLHRIQIGNMHEDRIRACPQYCLLFINIAYFSCFVYTKNFGFFFRKSTAFAGKRLCGLTEQENLLNPGRGGTAEYGGGSGFFTEFALFLSTEFRSCAIIPVRMHRRRLFPWKRNRKRPHAALRCWPMYEPIDEHYTQFPEKSSSPAKAGDVCVLRYFRRFRECVELLTFRQRCGGHSLAVMAHLFGGQSDIDLCGQLGILSGQNLAGDKPRRLLLLSST